MKSILIITIYFTLSIAKEIPQLLSKPKVTRITADSVQFEYGKDGGGKVTDNVECAGFVLDGSAEHGASNWETGSGNVTITGLSPDTEYQIAVKCRWPGENEYGPFSPTALIRTLCKYLDNSSIWPHKLLSYEITASRAIVKWEIPSHQDVGCTIQNFFISYWQKENSDSTQHVIVDASCKNYVLTDLLNSADYVVELSVIADNQVVGTPASTDFKTKDAVIGSVQYLTSNNTSSKDALYTWKAPSSTADYKVTNYYLYVTLKEVFQCIKLTLAEENRTQVYKTDQTSVSLKDLRPDSKYDIFIEAETSLGWNSGLKMSMTTYEDVPDGTPEKLNVTVVSPSDWTFQWDKISCYLVNGILIYYEYAVTRDDELNMNPDDWYLEPTITQETQVMVYNLTDDSDYNFFVRGCTKKGFGPWANILIESPLKKSAIFNPPEDVQIVQVSSTVLAFVWKKPKSTTKPPLGYKIKYKEVKLGLSFGEKFTNSNIDLSYRLEDLLPSSTYEISISTVYGLGESIPIKLNCSTTDEQNITTVGMKLPKPPKIRLDDENNAWIVEIYPMSNNSSVRAYQVIVENASNKKDIDEQNLQGYDYFSKEIYVTAEIDAKNISAKGYNFTLGDDLIYGGYQNVKLNLMATYRVYIRTMGENNTFSPLVQSTGDVAHDKFGEPEKTCVVAGLKCLMFVLLLTFIVLVLLCIVFLIFCVRHRRGKSGSHAIQQSDEFLDPSDESRKPSWVGSTRSYSLSYQTLMSQGETVS